MQEALYNKEFLPVFWNNIFIWPKWRHVEMGLDWVGGLQFLFRGSGICGAACCAVANGLTVVLRYRQGVLVQALTRGDGRSGMDVTSAILASGCAPAMLKETPEKLEVLGEVVMSLSAFNALNKRRREEGLEGLKNPRNSAAGTLRLKDHAEIARRGLEIRIFELIVAEPMPSTHTGALAMVSSLGLPAVESRAVSGFEVLRSIEEMNRDRANGPFRTDGIVVRLDDRTEFERLGKTAKYPRGAIARKYRAVAVETRLLRVEWMYGDTGRPPLPISSRSNWAGRPCNVPVCTASSICVRWI
ncbi:MAG: hypothetical protein DRP64_17125 [Verrucomicrobia bacterium]|nr:MAG: hypothetical protein DRP64_17125 [Verrucomicrobiota bacterium]